MKSLEWRVYLEDMHTGCQDVQDFTSELTMAELVANKAMLYATLHALQIIGEAAGRVPDNVRDQMPEVPWKDIVGLRHVVVHGYAFIDNMAIWNIVQHDVPILKYELETFLNAT